MRAGLRHLKVDFGVGASVVHSVEETTTPLRMPVPGRREGCICLHRGPLALQACTAGLDGWVLTDSDVTRPSVVPRSCSSTRPSLLSLSLSLSVWQSDSTATRESFEQAEGESHEPTDDRMSTPTSTRLEKDDGGGVERKRYSHRSKNIFVFALSRNNFDKNIY